MFLEIQGYDVYVPESDLREFAVEKMCEDAKVPMTKETEKLAEHFFKWFWDAEKFIEDGDLWNDLKQWVLDNRDLNVED